MCGCTIWRRCTHPRSPRILQPQQRSNPRKSTAGTAPRRKLRTNAGTRRRAPVMSTPPHGVGSRGVRGQLAAESIHKEHLRLFEMVDNFRSRLFELVDTFCLQCKADIEAQCKSRHGIRQENERKKEEYISEMNKWGEVSTFSTPFHPRS